MNTYLERARRALRTARSNLSDGDTIGASSRAYYGLFDAVRAVLSARHLADVDQIRTHHGLNHTFNVLVVKPGLMEQDTARALRRAFELRLSADYGSAGGVDPSKVEQVLEQAADFIEVCASLIEQGPEAP